MRARTFDVEGFDGVVRAAAAAAGRVFDADGFDGIARWAPGAPAGRVVDAEGLDGLVVGDWIRAVPVLVEVWATEPVPVPADALPTRLIARTDESPRERAARMGLTVVRSDGAPTERIPAAPPAPPPDPTDAPDLPLLDLSALELRADPQRDEAPEDVLPIAVVDHVPTEIVDVPAPAVEVEHLPTVLIAAVGPTPLPDPAAAPEPPSTTIDVRWDGWGSPGAPTTAVVEVEPTEVITPIPAPARAEPPEPASPDPAPTLVPVERAERPAPPPLEPLGRSPLPVQRTPAVPETPLPLSARPTRPTRPLPARGQGAPAPAPPPARAPAVPLPAARPAPAPRPSTSGSASASVWSLAAAALLLATSVVFAASVAGFGLAFALSRAPARDLVPVGRAAETIDPSNP